MGGSSSKPAHLVHMLENQMSIAQTGEKSFVSEEIPGPLCPGGFDQFFDKMLEVFKKPRKLPPGGVQVILEKDTDDEIVMRTLMHPKLNKLSPGESWSMTNTYHSISKGGKGAFGKVESCVRGQLSEKILNEYWFVHKYPLTLEYYQMWEVGKYAGVRLNKGFLVLIRPQEVVDSIIDDINIGDPEDELAKIKNTSGRKNGCKCF